MPWRPSALSQHANDPSTAAALNWAHFATELPRGLSLQWLGTAGFRLAYEGCVVYIDPYVTRVGWDDVLHRRTARPVAARIESYIESADAVLVGHTHFDHALDVPAISLATGCRAYGSTSLQQLMSLYGIVDRATVVEPHRVYEIGPFEVTFVPSLHSKLLLGLKVPADGEITCDSVDDLTPGAYCCGDVMGIHISVAGVTMYHQGSANLVDSEIRHRGVDFFLAGIAGRMFTPRYVERVLRRLEPRVVVPQHHDNFFRPLDAPMGFSFNVNFGGFVEDVEAVSRDFTVRALDLLQTVEG